MVYIFHLHQGFNGSKIHPPKYENGKKLGVFATRTPHRINSIGLTLCKFDRIENNEIFISCIDMVSGTPIIDIKPYHHLESVDVFAPGMKYPDWIKNADKGIKAKVTILPEAEKNLDDILSTKKLIFYSKKEELLPLIKGVLEIDPHSKYTKKKQGTLLYAFHLDKLNVIYEYNKTTSSLSDEISKDLYKRGMRFVGSTIIYSYLQAIGIIYSHDKECFMYKNDQNNKGCVVMDEKKNEIIFLNIE